MRVCKLEWCNNKYKALWYCSKHYDSYRNNWDPLICHKRHWEKRECNPLYNTYYNIIKRCNYIQYKWYKNYWWRWITICDRWLWIDWFTNFCNDMWERPVWFSIDRIDNNWNYEPSNCKWSSKHEQNSNKRNNNNIVWVSWNKQKQKRVSRISIKWKNINLWSFVNYQDAVNCRKNWEIIYINNEE